MAVRSESKVGTPVVAGAKVEGKVLAQVKGKKIVVYKYKSKKNERKKQGHRQPYTTRGDHGYQRLMKTWHYCRFFLRQMLKLNPGILGTGTYGPGEYGSDIVCAAISSIDPSHSCMV